MIKRATDPLANDLSHQVKTILGKLCDKKLSYRTSSQLLDDLSKLLAGEQMSTETFAKLGIDANIVEDENTGRATMYISVPKEYVSSAVTENRDSQVLEFGISKHLNLNFEPIYNSDEAKLHDNVE